MTGKEWLDKNGQKGKAELGRWTVGILKGRLRILGEDCYISDKGTLSKKGNI